MQLISFYICSDSLNIAIALHGNCEGAARFFLATTFAHSRASLAGFLCVGHTICRSLDLFSEVKMPDSLLPQQQLRMMLRLDMSFFVEEYSALESPRWSIFSCGAAFPSPRGALATNHSQCPALGWNSTLHHQHRQLQHRNQSHSRPRFRVWSCNAQGVALWLAHWWTTTRQRGALLHYGAAFVPCLSLSCMNLPTHFSFEPCLFSFRNVTVCGKTQFFG